ncbi:Putative lipid droplet-associated hydrolase, alpha/Beta hydrolase [Septoria linicola]|uniref:Lipid droplet-associated hydrolase, alpha/Beta hydrolase n=1 Tax=Septoria linicola TaxID=215465 RepID=A0A9Q9AL06_9PEZI|nr:putative lipid droplet-associated hydrolase, alpha/Beta hydrolase [Septoria linicola]USW51244.1 Putative lipid droplet-associated hydrolase, alpha/Beta hydrolase [Septoria linicola]
MPVNTDLQDQIELRSGRNSNSNRLLIYFIAGNPGLVEYYRRYLESLQKSLRDREEEVIIFGASHDGFEFHAPANRINEGPPPYSLNQEIHCVRSRLSLKARELVKEDSTKRLHVILIGHSVGAYMLLETIEWWQNQPSEQSICSVKGGICLFPTVVDIVKSDKGQTLRPVLNFPGMGYLLSGLATFCAWIGFLDQLTKWLTPGVEGGTVTAALARSDTGVRQVIHMARDELASINEDKWHATELWGVVQDSQGPNGALQDDEREASSSIATAQGTPRTKLYLLFGKDDYWVNNTSRDDLISKRSGKHTTMEVLHNRPEIPHTFSLHPEHSEHVAEKTMAWIASLEKGQYESEL